VLGAAHPCLDVAVLLTSELVTNSVRYSGWAVPGGQVAVTVSREAELLVLRHENAVLRRQVSRVRYQPCDRLWLATLSRLIPRHRWGEVFAVTPATLFAWHRRLLARKWDYARKRRSGRPSTAAAICKLVIRIATDNPT
jgi:putative transposase